jgi:hypothetical protein
MFSGVGRVDESAEHPAASTVGEGNSKQQTVPNAEWCDDRLPAVLRDLGSV